MAYTCLEQCLEFSTQYVITTVCATCDQNIAIQCERYDAVKHWVVYDHSMLKLHAAIKTLLIVNTPLQYTF
jgi:hypothetical protein